MISLYKKEKELIANIIMLGVIIHLIFAILLLFKFPLVAASLVFLAISECFLTYCVLRM